MKCQEKILWVVTDNIFGLPVAKRAVSNDDKEWDAVSATGIVSDAKDMGNVLSRCISQRVDRPFLMLSD